MVDREEQLVSADGAQDVGAEIERGDLRSVRAAELPGAVDRLDAAGGVEGDDAVDTSAAHGLGDLARRRRALVVHAEHLRAPADGAHGASQAAAEPAVAASQGDTYKQDDLIGAAEGVFGKGAEGLARLIEDVLSKQGEPNGYIVGREAGGAFVLGARYGSGTLFHKVEGQQPVYWTGPSIGFDVGADASKVFILVYNLHDSQQLFRRYPGGEGRAYFVGGFTATYLRRGDVVLIPIRLGVGVRLGVNAGYMRFSEKNRWLPF